MGLVDSWPSHVASNVSFDLKLRIQETDSAAGALATIQRTRIRKWYKLDGSVGSDCTQSFYCCCCVLARNEREVRDREEYMRRNAGPANGAYIAPGPMAYAPPPK